MGNEPLQRYSRHVYFNPGDRDYVALCTEFPYLSAFGDSPAEALEVLEAEIAEALDIYAEEGWPIPQPEAPPEPEGLPSGRFVTRLPKTLHARLARQAKREGVSLNQLVVYHLAAGLGESMRRRQPELLAAEDGHWLSRAMDQEPSRVHDGRGDASLNIRDSRDLATLAPAAQTYDTTMLAFSTAAD